MIVRRRPGKGWHYIEHDLDNFERWVAAELWRLLVHAPYFA